MKKYMLMGLLLMAGATVFAQSSSTKSNGQKWKARFRVISVIPTSKGYDLSGTNIKASSTFAPELDFTYFFSKNFGAELILGTTKHTVKAETGSATTDLGKIWLLPPTLNLQYHIPLKGVTPYFGAGINYTIFYGAKDGAMSLEYKNKVGFSTQAGLDLDLSKNWFLNLDIKKLFLKTDVKVATPSVTLTGVKLNPWIIGLGIGTRF